MLYRPRPRWICGHGKQVHEPTDGVHHAFNRPTDRGAGPPSPRLISAFYAHPTPDVNAWSSGRRPVSRQCIANSYAPSIDFRTSKRRPSTSSLVLEGQISSRTRSADEVETVPCARRAVYDRREAVSGPTKETMPAMSPISSLSRAPFGKRRQVPCHICTSTREWTCHTQSFRAQVASCDTYGAKAPSHKFSLVFHCSRHHGTEKPRPSARRGEQSGLPSRCDCDISYHCFDLCGIAHVCSDRDREGFWQR